MYLEKLNIRGFGCLRTQVEFASEKLNLAIADNEAGKTTLISAILAAFYGIEEDNRKLSDKRRPHIKNVVPWQRPEEFGVELDFVHNDKRWRIERDFHTGDVRLIDRDTGRDHANEYHTGKGRYQIGEKLLDLSVDSFLKSFYLKQEEILELREAGDLTHHIQQVATAIEGGITSGQAIERLRAARDKYPHPDSRDGLKIENAIKRFSDAREASLKEIEKLESERQSIEPQAERLNEIERQLEQLVSEREEAIRTGDMAEILELQKLIENQERLSAEAAKLATEVAGLKSFENFPADKWEQLISLNERVKSLETDLKKQEDKLKSEGIAPLEKTEAELQANHHLTGVTDSDLRDFEVAASRYADRLERLSDARAEAKRLEDEIKKTGLDRARFNQLKQAFASLTNDDKRFIESFRTLFAEAEAAHREQKTKLEWVEREREIILQRQRKVTSTARTFFLLAGIMVLTGAMLILLTRGGWLGQVLAGLGIFFTAVAVITRATAGGADVAALRKLDEDLYEVTAKEEETKKRHEQVGQDLTELAKRIGFVDGNTMLTDYLAFDQLNKTIEPLLAAEVTLEKYEQEKKVAADSLAIFFNRASRTMPDGDAALPAARELLANYRRVVQLSEEYRTCKIRRSEIEKEVERIRREFDSNSNLLTDLLRMGNIQKTEPLDTAINAFKESLDKHNRFRAISGDQLPRIQQELLPEVDVIAKKERLTQLRTKNIGIPVPTSLKHSKEYYRDFAERAARERESLAEERRKIDRAIATVFERFENNYAQLRQRCMTLEENIQQAETFRSDIDTATQIMTEISREVYRNWASALSEAAAPFIEALNPRYSDLKFDDQLNFSVLDRQTGRTITSQEAETILSTGARDEVFLAARLGIARYLSRGTKGAMPVVLDEPLAAVDDDKFLSGMQFFLGELSRQHQILLMSCHEERHRWLRDKVTPLFDERVQTIIL